MNQWTRTNNPARSTRRVFREEIREKLIEDILNGRLAPGSRIVETRIAQQFGVSQGPVREALRDLELFGFVVSSPFRGTQVRKISTWSSSRSIPSRWPSRVSGVPPPSASISRPSRHLEELIEVMREAAARDDHPAEADADHSFHHAIVKASGNRMLEHVWQTMRLSTTTCLTVSITHRSLHEIAERHVAVLERCVPAIPTALNRRSGAALKSPAVGTLRTSAGAGCEQGRARRKSSHLKESAAPHASFRLKAEATLR